MQGGDDYTLAFDPLGNLISFLTSSILPSWIVAGILSIFIGGYLAHYVKHRKDSSEKQKIAIATADQKVKETELIDIPINAYDRTQRVVHWLFAAVLIFLAVTGFEIYYYPNVARNALTVFSLVYHSNISTILLLLIVLHVFHDMRKPRALKQMSLSSFDFRMLISRTRNFLFSSSTTGSSPKVGKHDVFMKSYHWTLTALLGVLGITGLYLLGSLRDNIITSQFLLVDAVAVAQCTHTFSSDRDRDDDRACLFCLVSSQSSDFAINVGWATRQQILRSASRSRSVGA